MPLRQRVVVPHGLPDAILRAAPAVLPPGAEVIYISQAYRGLADIIALWRSRIAPENPAASFRAYIAAEDVGRFRALAGGAPSIRIFPRVANDEIPSLLRGARLLVAPGHSSETFCLSAAEAVAMGVPVVTLGHGALSERVVHGKTGFICLDYPDMGSRTLALLSDDALWLRMHAACLATRAEAGWDHVASLWEATLLSGERGGN